MESLTALRLASNVVQCVHFLSTTIDTTLQVSHSAQGASKKALEIESVYQNLHALQTRLRNYGQEQAGPKFQGLVPQHVDFSDEPGTQLYIKSLQLLASECDELCDELLETIRKLKVKDGPWRGCRSFVAALKAAWNEDKIRDLEKRIGRYQSAIMENFFPLLSQQQSYMLDTLTRIREQGMKLQLDQLAKLEQLTTRLDEIGKNVPLVLSNGRVVSSYDASEDSIDPPTFLERARAHHNYIKKMHSDEMQGIEDGIAGLSVASLDMVTLARQQAFIKTLNFPTRACRHEDIPLAHRRTFEWAVKPPEGTTEWESNGPLQLRGWLHSGDGIFWITGKAGSGKSTMLKFIADHSQTRASLEAWAGPKKLVTATHYFWTTGTTMQRSRKGLLQELVFDVFRSSPEYISEICPVQWSELESKPPSEQTQWTEYNLLQVLRKLSQHPKLDTKYCIFIDGIDEFDGDHFQMCQLLRDLSRSPNFKFCLTSRPWNVFEDAFGACKEQKLYIHDLTRQDIRRYSYDQLSEHWLWRADHIHQDQKDSVVDRITDKAQGVFLWVFLVTKSLREGLVNGDTMIDLQRRLDSFPADLEPFFKHMLDCVDSLYHQRMARILKVATNARQSLGLGFYEVLEYEEEDVNYALYKDLEETESTERSLDQCRRRINARCGGLLEVKNERVEFLHRTVRDFLRTRDMSDFLSEKSGREFKVNFSTLKGFIFLFRRWTQSQNSLTLNEDLPFWREGLEYANAAIEEAPESTIRHLDAVEGIYSLISGYKDSDFLVVEADYVFTSEMVRAGVHRFVNLKLEQDAGFFDNIFESPLETAFQADQWLQGHIDIATAFLESGQEVFESAWRRFVSHACQSSWENFRLAVENNMFSLFLECGAERKIRIQASSDFQLNSSDVISREQWCQTNFCFPLTVFVKAIFLHRESHRLTALHLIALDAFLGGINKCETTQLEELISALVFQLNQYQLSRRQDPERLLCYHKVIERIIKKGSEVNFKMDIISPHLREIFPGSKGSALVDMIEGKARHKACLDRKRRIEESSSYSTWKKQRNKKD